MNQKEAKKIGFDKGFGIGEMLLEENTYTDIDTFTVDGGEAEVNARQYSPFEFTAKEFNESKYPDEIWDAYDDGVYKGLAAAWKEWSKKNE